jgi:cell division protein FtsQ
MPVSAPSDRRFRRAHLSPARRRPWYRTWTRRLIGAAAVAAGGAAAYALLALSVSWPALTVRTVSVSGNQRLSKGEVLALLDGLDGHSLLTLDIERWRGQLRQSLWVADADLRRLLPDTVRVEITEKRPVGIARLRGELFLIDATGSIIDDYTPNYADIDLPLVYGLDVARGGALMVDERRAALASRLLTDLQEHPGLLDRVSQIDVSDARNAVVVLVGDTVNVRLGTEKFVERIESYIELAETLRERAGDIDSADLRYGHQVVVSPRTASARPRPVATRGKG